MGACLRSAFVVPPSWDCSLDEPCENWELTIATKESDFRLCHIISLHAKPHALYKYAIVKTNAAYCTHVQLISEPSMTPL